MKVGDLNMARKPTPKPVKMANGDIMWRVQFRLHPKANPTSEKFQTSKAAERFINRGLEIGWEAAREERNIGKTSAAAVPSLTDYAREYFAQRPNITPRTRSDYYSTARRSWEKRTIGGLPVDVITSKHVEAFVADYQDSGISRKTAEQARSLLAQVLQHAVEHRVIQANPVQGVRVRKGERLEMTFLTPSEFDSLMKLCPQEGKPLIYFLYSTGARIGEATALKWKDLDIYASPAVARISRTWTKDEAGKRIIGPPKTGLANRTISLAPEMVALLGKRQQGESFVFETFGQRKGKPITRQSFYKMIWKPLIDAANDPKACEAAGIKPLGKRPRMHDLRHSHASYLIHQNLPMNIIQRRLGHESVKTTSDTYGHLMPDALMLAAQASSASIQRTSEKEAAAKRQEELDAYIEAQVQLRMQERLKRLLEP